MSAFDNEKTRFQADEALGDGALAGVTGGAEVMSTETVTKDDTTDTALPGKSPNEAKTAPTSLCFRPSKRHSKNRYLPAWKTRRADSSGA